MAEQQNTPFPLNIVKTFLSGQASILFIVFSLLLGMGAIWLTPREEEPQIVVPMADIFVNYPGASAQEVEKMVSSKLEKLLWQIDGVEYVYSVSRQDQAIVTVRFFVKEDRERSLIKLYNKIQSNIDQVIPGISGWIVKPVEIDDVPILSFHLYSSDIGRGDLRRIASEAAQRIAKVGDISGVKIYGGESREIRVEFDPAHLAHWNLSSLEIAEKLKAADSSLKAGFLESNQKHIELRSGPFFESIEEVKELVIAVKGGRIIRLRDVAEITDTFQVPRSYTRFGIGGSDKAQSMAAVAVAVSKIKGSNAVEVAKKVLDRLEEIKTEIIPGNVNMEVTRNYGKTANEKVWNLLTSLLLAISGVVLLVAFSLGWREAAVIALAVPISFSLSLLVNYLSGYTINRVTLFALILSLGLVVDDPITNVDNIKRHIQKDKKNPFLATLLAVKEVLSPVLMSTLSIIVSFLPMFFITGMMGPYMEPMAINVPLTVSFSTLCALTIVPWASYHLLKNQKENESSDSQATPRMESIFRMVLEPILKTSTRRWIVPGGAVALLGICGALVLNKMVPLKMLPFDNKDEFQIVVNMREGTTLQRTDSLVRDLEHYLRKAPEVKDFQSYVGISSPMDFNGMVRHYYLRKAPHQADIRVNLVQKKDRNLSSHDIVLKHRKKLSSIAARKGGRLEIVEVPPGPPVLATVVAELYTKEEGDYERLIESARIVEKKLLEMQGVEDVDLSLENQHEEIRFQINREKAALHGISTQQINQALRLALDGLEPASLHLPRERNMVGIRILSKESEAHQISQLENLRLRSKSNSLVPLGEVGSFQSREGSHSIYHKNLRRVILVTAEVVGTTPGEVILELMSHFREHPLDQNIELDWAGEGEWKITLDVFRDLGLAFGAALVGIYILIVLETSSWFLPLLIMVAIPLTAIGIIPGFYILNLMVNQPVGGFDTPVFFTATGMIGMIALGGIVVRNSMVLIEFIRSAQERGVELKEALIQSVAVRFRPIVLTAGTTMLGAVPITLDPIFSGLAWSLIFGLLASTFFTLVVVPTVYYMVFSKEN